MVNQSQNDAEAWTSYYMSLSESFLFPNEYVVRSFLGSYPKLSMSRDYLGKAVCDVSCGDGRNIVALRKLGLTVSGSEITEAICAVTREKLKSVGVVADLRAGTNKDLPFDSESFDYLLSWNACYYMATADDHISAHVEEFSRVLKPNGFAVISVPAPGCFSLLGAEPLGSDLIRINTNSKWNMLNGMIYYKFKDFQHIRQVFGTHFTNFSECKIDDDCFGLPLQYHVFVCQRKP